MRRLVLLGFGALFCMSCETDVLGHRYSRAAVCGIPSPPKGMHSVRPTEGDATAVWQALDLRAEDHIYFWFEDGVGNVRLGITDGTNDWQVDLVESGSSYIATVTDWRERETICIG